MEDRLLEMAVRLQDAFRLEEVIAEFFRALAEMDADIGCVIGLRAAWGARRILRLSEMPPDPTGRHGLAWRIRVPGVEIDILLWRGGKPFATAPGAYWAELRRQIKPAFARAFEYERVLEEVSLLRAEFARLGAFVLEEGSDGVLRDLSPGTAAALARHFPSDKALEAFLKRIHARLDVLAITGETAAALPNLETGAGLLRFKARLAPNGRWRILYVTESASFQPTPKIKDLGLSPRRSEVLHWILEGKSNLEIALILGIGAETVKEHVRWLLAHFQVRRRGELLRYFSL